MLKIRLGGAKAQERQAYLSSSCPNRDDTLGDICSRLAGDGINLSLLTHVADFGAGCAVTSACTDGTDGFNSYIRWKESHGECSIGKLHTDTSLISLFPHEYKPGVIGSIIASPIACGVIPFGFASSPSALTVILSPSDLEGVTDAFFGNFDFPSSSSALEWRLAHRAREKPQKEVVCSYREDIIKIYNITRYLDLDLWSAMLPLEHLGHFGQVLKDLDEPSLKMPFLVSELLSDVGRMLFSFCLASDRRDQVGQVLRRSLPGLELSCLGPATVFYLLGPHFGDRYGIADTLLRVLRSADIPLLALSYTVSSFSLVIQGVDPGRTVEALHSHFEIPGRRSHQA